MKKFLVVVGAVVLLAAMASPSFAQTEWVKQFKATSLFQMWSVWINKYDFNNNYGKSSASSNDLTKRGLHQRINFYLDWGDAKYVRGVIGFEADSTNWGEKENYHYHSTSSTNPNGLVTNNPSAKMGQAGTDQVQLEIKHAYLQATIPNTPVMVTYGLQGMNFGGRLFQSRDLPGLVVEANFAPHKIRAIWWREQEGYLSEQAAVTSGYNSPLRNYYHVNDTYGLTYDLTQKLFNVSALFFFKNDLVGDAASGFVANVQPTYRDQPWWIGVGGGFRPGNLAISGQFIYNGGKRDLIDPAAQDLDYTAWAAEILATYQIGPGLSVAVEGFYGTGNDTNKTDKISMYQVPAGSECYANFGLGRSVLFFMNFSQLGGAHNLTNTNNATVVTLGGYWYARLNAQYAPAKWVNLSFNYLYLNDTSSGSTGTFNSIGRTDSDKTFVGHEINLITTLRIYQNFTWNIGIAALIPGEIFDHPDKKADTMYGINTGMQLAF